MEGKCKIRVDENRINDGTCFRLSPSPRAHHGGPYKWMGIKCVIYMSVLVFSASHII